ncbi:hypothetical protein BDAP_002739 [Binucleata daphniae]
MEQAKEFCINKIDLITSISKKKMLIFSRKIEKFENILNEKHHNEAYKPIFDKIKHHEKKTNCLAEDIHKTIAKTLKILKNENGEESLFGKILNIISLQENIQEKLESINYDKKNTFDSIIILKRNLIAQTNEIENETDNKEAKKMPKDLKTLAYNAIISSKVAENMIINNKAKIVKIITDTIQLKSMIEKVEQDTFEHIKAIKTYINDEYMC